MPSRIDLQKKMLPRRFCNSLNKKAFHENISEIFSERL